MANETDFLNDALGQIGATRINSINDNSVNANHCKTFYNELRRAIIQSHNWNFATDRASLAAEPDPPPFEYAFAYPLPADYIKLTQYNGFFIAVNVAYDPRMPPMEGRYVVEGRKILTNDAEVKIVYLKDVTNPDLWDPLFYQALSSWLASKLASAIAKDAKKSSELLRFAEGVLMSLATAADGQVNSVLPLSSPQLLWGR